MLSDGQESALENGVCCELFSAGKKPGIHFRVNGAQFRLQARCVTLRVVHQKTWIDAEESRQQLACRVCQMGPGAIFDLREIRLAQAAADLALHRGSKFLLGHRATQSAEGTFHRAEGAEFVAEFHGKPIIAICKYHITYRYFVKHKIAPVFNHLQTYLELVALFWLAEGLQVDSQLLALLIQVAALEPQRSRHIGHVEVVPPDFGQHHFPLERFGAFGQRAR